MDWGVSGEGGGIEAAVDDFKAAYEDVKACYREAGKPFEEKGTRGAAHAMAQCAEAADGTKKAPCLPAGRFLHNNNKYEMKRF